MHQRSRIILFLCVLALAVAASPAAAIIIVNNAADWSTTNGVVRIHLQFMNPSPTESSDPTTGHVMSQEYGAFLPDYGPIGDFNVPPLPPNSFFDVFFDVSLSSLPPNPQEIFGGGGTGSPTGMRTNSVSCDPGDHWDGNIDVSWSSASGNGQTNYHIGDIKVCPGGGNSYIHVKGFICPSGPVGWAVVSLCSGFSATLVNEDFSPAPNPLPPGWTGWICVSANATVTSGTTCCVRINVTCGGVTVPIDLCATACDCVTPAVPSTWGGIKALYR